jgi:flagellar motor switch protein FliM
VDQGKKQTFYMSLLKHTKAYMIHKDSEEEKKEEMNEEGERLFLQLELDIESHTRKERLRILEGMKKNSTKHFSEFHMRLLFKVAKLLVDESMV